MEINFKPALGLPIILSFLGCQTIEEHTLESNTPAPIAETTASKPTPQAFAWPFLESESMAPRGGMTRGSPVALATEPSAAWTSLQAEDLDKFEKDRRAILAMVGNYRAGFQFVETGGYIDGYSPAKPYFSWGTENVSLLEDSGDFISLQHVLVMYMIDESGNTMGPFVMKHWRQDWTYQKSAIHTYQGNRTWERRDLKRRNVRGKWIQSVFQVDDSPRYEVVGGWTHGAQYSSWASEASFRPLPRREYSVRDDYNILEGEHRLTITPTGWIHEQHNRKVNRIENIDTYIAQEIGFTRYELITEPDLSPAADSWQKVGEYWSHVRKTWSDIFAEHDRFQLESKVDGKSLWEIHFMHAAEIEKADGVGTEKWSEDAVAAIDSFLNTGTETQAKVAY